jgi:hypothetical protein
MNTTVRILSAALAAAPFVAAQTTFVVDANGSGHFRDIPPAILAASPGDRIEILPGSYSAFTVRAGLDIEATRGGVSVPWARVESVPAGQWLRLDRLEIRETTSSGVPGLVVTGCAGAVLLRGLDVTRATGFASGVAGVVIESARLVQLVGCRCAGGWNVLFGVGGHGLTARASTVVATESSIEGGATGATATPGVAGLFADQATVVVGATTSVGGKGGPSTSSFGSSCWTLGPGGPGGPGIGGTGTVIASAASVLQGGDGGDPNPFAGNCAGVRGPAVQFQGSALVSSDCTLVGASNATTIAPQPRLTVARNAARGTTTNLTVATMPAALVGLLIDIAPGSVFRIPGIDVPYLLSPSAVPLLSGTANAGGVATFALVLPLDPALRERDLLFQAAAVYGTPLAVHASSLGVLRVR